MYQNVSDEAISASDSASFIIAQLTAFGDSMSNFTTEAEKAQHVIDAVNEVANNFAVSSGQLATNLGNMSAVMSQTGASFEESLGMLTAITEVTRNASKASRGLVSIGSRLVQITDESSSTGKALKEIYEELGITLFDQEGQLRSSYEIFSDLAEIWDTLDTNTQNYIASQQAGTNQFQNFAALMSNFSTAAEATSIALNSAGSATQENSRYMESLNAKVSQLQSTFQQLSNQVVDSEIVKFFLDLANGVLQLTKALPPGIIQTGLLSGLGFGITELVKATKILPVITSQFKEFGAALELTGDIKSFSDFTTVLKMGLGGTLPIILAVAGAIVTVVTLVNSFKKAYDELNPTVEEINAELETQREKIRELSSIPASERTDAEQRMLDLLKEQNAELEKQKQLTNQRTLEEWNKKAGYSGTQYKLIFEEGSEYAQALEERWGDVLFNSYEEIQQAIEMDEELANSFENLDAVVTKTGERFDTQGEAVMAMVDKYRELEQTTNRTADEQEEFERLGAAITDTYNTLSDGYTDIERTNAGLQDMYVAAEQVANSWTALSSQIDITNNGFTISAEQAQKLIQIHPELASKIVKVGEAYRIETTALQDLIKSGDTYAESVATTQMQATRATIEQIQKRSSLYKTELSAMLGLNEAMTTTLYDSMSKEEQARYKGLQQSIYYSEQKVQNLLNQLENQTNTFFPSSTNIDTDDDDASSAGSKVAQDVLEGFKSELEKDEHKIFLLEEKDAVGNADAIQDIYTQLMDKVHAKANELRAKGYAEDSEEVRELQEIWWGYYDERAKIAEEALEREKEAWEDAIKELKDSLEEQKDNWDTTFSYIIDKAESELESLESIQDSINDKYDKQIEALEAANDELQDQIEKEEALDALARARQTQVMVYKDGRFQYVNDIDEVSSAQKNLEDIRREEELQAQKDAIEAQRDIELQAIEDQIEYWTKFKEEWENAVDSFSDNLDRLIAEQVLGVNLQQENWEKSLQNLQDYVNKYNELLNQIKSVEAAEEQGFTTSGGGISGAGNKTDVEYWQGVWHAAQDAYESGQISKEQADEIKNNAHANVENIYQGTGATYNPATGVWTWASGTTNAPGGLSLVGENGPELRVLNSGDGIIPSDITKNLWDWGKFSPSSFFSKNESGMTSVTIQNLNLPNVQNAQDFVNYIKNNFWRKTVQLQTS